MASEQSMASLSSSEVSWLLTTFQIEYMAANSNLLAATQWLSLWKSGIYINLLFLKRKYKFTVGELHTIPYCGIHGIWILEEGLPLNNFEKIRPQSSRPYIAAHFVLFVLKWCRLTSVFMVKKYKTMITVFSWSSPLKLKLQGSDLIL